MSAADASSWADAGLSATYVAERCTLVASYAALALVSLLLLLRTRLNRQQRLYQSFLISGTIRTLKMAYFGVLTVASWLSLSYRQAFSFVLGSLPSFLFATAFSLLFYFWLTALELSSAVLRKMQQFIAAANVLTYAGVAALYGLDIAYNNMEADLFDRRLTGVVSEQVVGYASAVVCAPTALGFLVIARICFLLAGRSRALLTQEDSEGITGIRTEQLPVVGALAIFCAALYCVRMMLLIVFQLNQGPFIAWWWEFLYYMLFEIVPLLLMSLVNHNRPLIPGESTSAIFRF
eukprot:m51a1_g11314 hypothetical protein (292) ;mRNA; r:100380-101720